MFLTVSLSQKSYNKLEVLQKTESRSRSEIIRSLIDKYDNQKTWEELFVLGDATTQEYDIKSEEDVLKIIED